MIIIGLLRKKLWFKGPFYSGNSGNISKTINILWGHYSDYSRDKKQVWPSKQRDNVLSAHVLDQYGLTIPITLAQFRQVSFWQSAPEPHFPKANTSENLQLEILSLLLWDVNNLPVYKIYNTRMYFSMIFLRNRWWSGFGSLFMSMVKKKSGKINMTQTLRFWCRWQCFQGRRL